MCSSDLTRDARGALHVRQLPGEKNALGLMKLVMPNPLSVYLHDTPSKALFDRDVRAFSHGCIHTDDALGFAETLLSGTPGWDRASIDAAIVAGKTVQVDLGKPMPVYVGYFTLWAATDGTLTSYPDVYKLDEAIAAALN